MSSTAQLTLDAPIRFGSGLCPFLTPVAPALLVEPPEEALGDPESPDLDWVAKVRSGDGEATRTLFRRLYPLVIKLVRCRLPRHASEEDLAQIVFSKVFAKLDQFSGRVPLEHWVSRIAINTCLTELRAEINRSELRMSDLTQEQEAVVQQLMTSDDELPGSSSQAARELVQKLLQRLTAEERLVITLLHIEEKSVQDISKLTGWSRSATRVKAFRARRRMRKELANISSRDTTTARTLDEF